MAKDPAFPFYAQDYLVDTLRWSRGMQGLHVSLMAESWANGGLMDDNGMPAGLGSTDVELWLKIKHKWKLVDGLWVSDKLESVRAERIAFREKQRQKGILSGEKRKKQQTPVQPKANTGSTMVEPIEDESEDEDEKKKKEGELNSKLEIFEALFSDQKYFEQLQMTHKGKDLNAAFEECYTHHSVSPRPPTELWEWRQKLNTWLTIKGENKNGNGHSKKQSHTDSLKQAIAERIMRESGAG